MSLGMLFQMKGSVWCKVIPYCILNVVIGVVFWRLKHNDICDWSFSKSGHTSVGTMVSFLLVTRFSIAYHRFMDSASDMMKCYLACRELIQHLVCLTMYETSAEAREWRFQIARQTVCMLRLTVDYLRTKDRLEHRERVKQIPISESEYGTIENFEGQSGLRCPLVYTTHLRKSIAQHKETLESPLPVNYELKLYGFVLQYVAAYHDIMKLQYNPFPFPIVQMNRTLLIIWLYTLSLPLLNDVEKFEAYICIIFFATFGFLGLELVAIELDDPFGDDDNDLAVEVNSMEVFNDIALNMQSIDGVEAKNRLLKTILKRSIYESV